MPCKVAPKRFEISGHLFVCFVVIFLRVISWIVLLAYNKKTIHEGTRTNRKKHEEESRQTLMLDFCSIPAKDLLTFSLPDIVRLVLRRLEIQESNLAQPPFKMSGETL